MDAVLELEITTGPEPGTYIVDVLRSVGGGEPTATFELDLEEILDRRPALEDSVLSSSVPARRIMSATEAAIQGVGRQLFDAVFRDDVATAYRTSLAVASDRGGGIQVVLRLTAPGIAALPWEALFDAETGTYLCRKEPLVRHVPAPYTPPVLAVKPPLRILGMISSPRGLPPLDVDAEKELLEEALRPHLDAGRVEIDWIDQVTWTAVHDKLLEREWHVLHFIGHGTYDAETDEGVLAFVGRDGRADYVSASSLADLLDEAEPSPRLVLLNSCRSAAGSTDDLFSGTAAALVHSGIHAVAAMQFSISDTAAIEFARGFYAALAHGRGIDEAVRSGRIGILGITRGTLEWVTPVLYLRGEDTKLFDVAPLPSGAVEREPEPSRGTGHPTEPHRHSPPPRPAEATHAADSGDVPVGPIPVLGPAFAATPSAATPSAATPSAPTPSAATPSAPTPSAPTASAATPTAPPTSPTSSTSLAEPVPTTVGPRPPAAAMRTATPDRAPDIAPVSEPLVPWWTASNPVVSGGRRPSAVRPSGGEPPAGGPPSRPGSSGPPSTPGTRRWVPWMVIGVVALFAVGGGAAVLLTMQPGGTSDSEVTSVEATDSPVDAIDRTAPNTDGGADPDANRDPDVIVPMDQAWTPTGRWCEAGDSFEITVTGTAHHNESESSLVGPDGLVNGEHPESRVPGFEAWNTASVIGGFPDHNHLGFSVGTSTTYRCELAGQLYLGINDTDLAGNHDAFEAWITEVPGG